MKFIHALYGITILSLQAYLGQCNCPIDGCPNFDGKEEGCSACPSSAWCVANDWCAPGDCECGCVAWYIPYCGKANCNAYTYFVDGGQCDQQGAPGAADFAGKYFRIRGKTSKGNTDYCWELRKGKTHTGNKIILGNCGDSTKEDWQSFMITQYKDAKEDAANEFYYRFSPKLDSDKSVGVRDSNKNRAWLRLEPASFVDDPTHAFYLRKDADGEGFVTAGIGYDDDCQGSEGPADIPDKCFLVTNQGNNADKADPVMLRKAMKFDQHTKLPHGKSIQKWVPEEVM